MNTRQRRGNDVEAFTFFKPGCWLPGSGVVKRSLPPPAVEDEERDQVEEEEEEEEGEEEGASVSGRRRKRRWRIQQ